VSGRWRIRRRLDRDTLLDLSQETYPGELDRPVRRDTPEDERNVTDLDELEAEEAAGSNPWAAEMRRLVNLPTVVVSVSAPGQSIDMSVTAPLYITRQVVEMTLAELEARAWSPSS